MHDFAQCDLIAERRHLPRIQHGEAGGKPTFIGGNNSPTNLKEEVVVSITISPANSRSSVTSLLNRSRRVRSQPVEWCQCTHRWRYFGNPSYSAVVHATYTISSNLLNETGSTTMAIGSILFRMPDPG